MSIWPFRRSRASEDAEKLLVAVTQASRRPAFFGPGRAPDTLQGRFELMTLNASLAMLRLRAEPGAEPLAQSFADQLFRSFDAGLREDGVGDTAVPKRMHKLAADFYGRAKAYAEALEKEAPVLEEALQRNILGADSPFAPALAAYVRATRKAQADAAVTDLFVQGSWAADLG